MFVRITAARGGDGRDDDRFYIALCSALEQTRYIFVACDSK